MSENPIGTITDEERLVPLHAGDDRFVVDVTDPVRTADVPEEGTFTWHLIEDGDAVRLAVAPVENPDEAGDVATAELSDSDERRTLAVPDRFLDDGLGLDTGAYDDDNPLLFEPEEITDGIAVGMTAAGDPAGTAQTGIELRPVRYADGTPYRAEPLAGETLDSDPVAEAQLERERGEDGTPQSDTISAPVDGDVVDDAVEATDASRSAVVDALETMARQGIVSVGDDDLGTGPMVLDDRAVIGLREEDWEETVAGQLDADDATIEAVREIHARQAEVSLDRTDTDMERFPGTVPVVVQPDHHYESDEPPD